MIVGWQLADTLETDPVLQAFDRAFSEHGIPEAANGDQGSTFAADAFADVLAGKGIAQSMTSYTVRGPAPGAALVVGVTASPLSAG